MKHYYSDAAVTIYHGDAREFVPEFESGLVEPCFLVTDPPRPGSPRLGGGGVTFAAKLADGLAAALSLRDADLTWEAIPFDGDQRIGRVVLTGPPADPHGERR